MKCMHVDRDVSKPFKCWYTAIYYKAIGNVICLLCDAHAREASRGDLSMMNTIPKTREDRWKKRNRL